MGFSYVTTFRGRYVIVNLFYWISYLVFSIFLLFRKRWKRIRLMGKRKKKEKSPIRVKNVVWHSQNLRIWSNTCKVIRLRYLSFTWLIWHDYVLVFDAYELFWFGCKISVQLCWSTSSNVLIYCELLRVQNLAYI